jgi:iduronate 2-sulfatase
MAWFNSDGYVKAPERLGLTMPSFPNRSEAINWNGYELRSYEGVPPRGPISDNKQIALLHAYAACVSYVDAQIGKILDAVESSGHEDKTIFVLLSDHGWHLGEASAWGKMTNFEIATRVPLLISAPGIPPGRTRTIAELVDVFPTLCELIDLPFPSHLQGESLVETLGHPTREAPDAVALSQYERFGGAYRGRAIRTDRYRFVAWEEVATEKVVARELYDHAFDPEETINLANLPANNRLVKVLEQRLDQAFATHSSNPAP